MCSGHVRLAVAIATLLFTSAASADPLTCNLSEYRPVPGLTAAVANNVLTATWDGDQGQQVRLRLTVVSGTPTIQEMAVRTQGSGDWKIYPGWYMGRATHIHVDVAVNGRSVKVTQIAFPESVTAALYATGVYASKGQNPTTNASDNVFADSVASEMAAVSGNSTSGYTATFTVGIAV